MEQALSTFALIDNCSGFFWWSGAAETPEEACAQADLDTGNVVSEYKRADQLASNESGYLVYSAPEGYEAGDGQEKEIIDAVSAMPLIGRFKRTESE